MHYMHSVAKLIFSVYLYFENIFYFWAQYFFTNKYHNSRSKSSSFVINKEKFVIICSNIEENI